MISQNILYIIGIILVYNSHIVLQKSKYSVELDYWFAAACVRETIFLSFLNCF